MNRILAQASPRWLMLLALLVAGGCSVERVEKGGGSPVTASSGSTGPGAGLESDTPAALPAEWDSSEKPVVAFVSNGIASFWTVAEAGCRAAAKDFDCECKVLMPVDGVADQKRILEELISQKIDGIAVSPIDPANQTDSLNAVARVTNLLTQDSDAPNSQRLAYIGMDNYRAGRLCGQLVKEALPSGGEVMLFVGRLGQLNAEQRRQGIIDELLDRSDDPTRRDPPSARLTGDKYTILDTRTDNFNEGSAKAQAEDAIVANPNLACMVGLFAYNPPAILEALSGAGKLGSIKVVGFDEDQVTLKAIQDGHCYGTVVQNPYMYGYESVRMLCSLARGDRSVLPPGKVLHIPARQIRRETVDAFWTELKRLLAGGSASAPEQSTSPSPAAGSASRVPPDIKLAFVTNNPSDFWKIAEAGVRKAEREFNVQCEMQLPPNGTADDQQRIIEALISRQIQGMAISPNDAENQVSIINQACEVMPVICHDSDAPKSNRTAYVGTRNYKAGREAGKQVRAVLPDGGKVMVFVGRMDALNAVERSSGLRDEIAEGNSKIEIIDIMTDLTDRARAKQNVEDTLVSHPDIGCLVGLWSYNGPAILEAVTDAGRAGKIPIVCFDEEDRTLQGVADGHIQATIVQQPFEFGYQSVRILAAIIRGQDPGIPADGIIEIPVRVINRQNVAQFWDDLQKLRGK